ncbi:CGNR zinc finger domain-containing protein [Fodinicola acaciae]|uniref:CGNR zinc finger domain-containing protein n=1 Tax=Fodinicola acaciae TaxID=2681555 RepID=UPI0013D03468|nr:CGNR zinc finger domain-containing protein [Fodinicola acaciae]
MGETGEQVLLDLLNSTPVTATGTVDLVSDEWAAQRGGVGSGREVAHLRAVRDRLQAVVRAAEPATTLEPLLDGVRMLPGVDAAGLRWSLDVEDDRRLGTQALLAWGRLNESMPGRLRPCANDECRLFLLDRSHANSARWCSMKVCGNRMKARRHYRRNQA